MPLRGREERVDFGTLQVSIDLTHPRVFYIRRHISFIGIDYYDGASNLTFLQYGDNEATRQEIVEGKYWQWPFHRSDIRIINTVGQPGATLKFTIGGAGAVAYPPTVSGALKVKDSTGIVINPATEDGNLQDLKQVFNPGYDLTWADINISTAGDNTIVSAPGAGSKIYVRYLVLVNASTSNVQTILIKSATTVKGRIYLGKETGYVHDAPHAPIICGDNEAFILNLSAADTVVGYALYETL